MALAVNALTTLAIAKDHLNIPASILDEDVTVERLINMASEYIERDCNRVFREITETVDVDSRAGSEVLLPRRPVSDISEVRVDSMRVFGADTILNATGFAFSVHGNLERLDGYFPFTRRGVRVTYTAGFATTPYDLEHGCLMLVEYYYRHNQDRRVGTRSKTKREETIGYLEGVPVEISALWESYKLPAAGWTVHAVRNL